MLSQRAVPRARSRRATRDHDAGTTRARCAHHRLADAEPALPFAKLRERCRVRAATLSQRLAALAAEGRLIKTNGGYRLAG